MRIGLSIGIGWGVLALSALIAPMSWQQYQRATSPAVAAIRTHPITTTATVIEPEIDGMGGDPALAYRYTVSGRTYEGFDVGNETVGDVLSMKPGEPVSIVYAATMPQESCLVGSRDCPGDVFDPYFPAFMFWAILIGGSLLGAVFVGLVLLTRLLLARRLSAAG